MDASRFRVAYNGMRARVRMKRKDDGGDWRAGASINKETLVRELEVTLQKAALEYSSQMDDLKSQLALAQQKAETAADERVRQAPLGGGGRARRLADDGRPDPLRPAPHPPWPRRRPPWRT